MEPSATKADLGKAEALLDIIKSRRSVRAYKSDPVPHEYVKMMLEACITAPNGENAQPWRFVIVEDRETIRKLGLLCARASGRRFLQEHLRGDLEKRLAAIPEEKRKKVIRKMVEGRVSGFVGLAPLVIAFLTDMTEGFDNVMDVSAAAENALLMASALGLGACWVISSCKDPRDEKKTRDILGVPEGFHTQFLISVGFPDEAPRPRPRRPIEQVTFVEKFGQIFEG